MIFRLKRKFKIGGNFSKVIDRNIHKTDNNAFVKRMALMVFASGGIIAGLYNGAVSLFVFVVIALYLVSTCEIQNAYEVLFFLVPFANVFKLAYGTPSLVTALQLVLLFRLFFLSRSITLSKCSFALGIVFALYCIVRTPTQIVTILLFSINVLFLLSSTMKGLSDHIRIGKIIIAFSLAIIMAAMYNFLKEYIAPLGKYITDTLYRLEDQTALDRLSGLYENPNYFSIDITIAMAGMYCAYMRRDVSARIFYSFEIILLALGIMTQSTTFTITLMVFEIWVVFSMLRNKPYELGKVAIFLAIIFILCAPILHKTILPYLTRFADKVEVLAEGGNVNEFSTDRVSLWKYYLSDMDKDASILLFGKGYGAVYISDMRAYDSHNAFIQMLYCFGIVGSIIYISFFLSIIHFRKRNGSKAYSSIFIIVLLVRCLTANIAVYDNLFYYVVIAYLLQQEPMEYATI